MVANVGMNQIGNFAQPVVATSPQPNGPGGNPIVPTPATPSVWWKMFLAMGIGAGGIWLIAQMGSEEAAKWTALLAVLGIATYYETHNNHQLSSGIQDLLGSFK